MNFHHSVLSHKVFVNFYDASIFVGFIRQCYYTLFKCDCSQPACTGFVGATLQELWHVLEADHGGGGWRGQLCSCCRQQIEGFWKLQPPSWVDQRSEARWTCWKCTNKRTVKRRSIKCESSSSLKTEVDFHLVGHSFLIFSSIKKRL